MMRQFIFVLLLSCGSPSAASAADILCETPTREVAEAMSFVEDRMGQKLGALCIHKVKRSKLEAVFHGSSHITRDIAELEAVFEPRSKGIFLSETLDLANPVDLSFLVHELVHAAQFEQSASGSEQPIGYLEYEAYSLQSSFLKSRGFDHEALLYNLLGLLQATSASDYRYEPDGE